MPESASSTKSKTHWVEDIEELFEPEEYFHGDGKRLRVTLKVSADGTLELLADSPHTGALDKVLQRLFVSSIDKIPCG